MESSAQVPDQGHKSPIRPFDRHPGKGCLLREIDLDSVGIMVGSPHQIISLTQQVKYFIHYLDAGMYVTGSRFNCIRLRHK